MICADSCYRRRLQLHCNIPDTQKILMYAEKDRDRKREKESMLRATATTTPYICWYLNANFLNGLTGNGSLSLFNTLHWPYSWNAKSKHFSHFAASTIHYLYGEYERQNQQRERKKEHSTHKRRKVYLCVYIKLHWYISESMKHVWKNRIHRKMLVHAQWHNLSESCGFVYVVFVWHNPFMNGRVMSKGDEVSRCPNY